MTKRRKQRGRPTGSRNEKTIVRGILSRKTKLTIDGVEQRATIGEALLLQLDRLRMAGNIPADRALAKLHNIVAPEPEGEAGILLVPEPLDAKEWIRRQNALNAIRKPPDDMSGGDGGGGGSGGSPGPSSSPNGGGSPHPVVQPGKPPGSHSPPHQTHIPPRRHPFIIR